MNVLPVWWWVRADLRRRWPSLAVLAALVALASGVVLASAAGARRTGSAYDRLRAGSLPADVAALPNEPGFDWDAVRALPEVAEVGEFAVTTFGVAGFGQGWAADDTVSTFPPASPEMCVSIERGVLRAGRWADPSRPDEVVIGPGAQRLGIGLGDHLQLQTFLPATLETAYSSDLFPPADGPVQDVTVVGIAKGSFLVADDTSAAVVPTVAFTERYWDNLVGRSGYVNALVRLRPGATIEDFDRDLEAVAGRPVELMDIAALAKRTTNATDLERNALVAFAVVAAVAACVLIGQALVRLVAVSAADLAPLRALGFTRRQSAAALAAGPVGAGIVGALGGVLLGWRLSTWFPIGVARRLEPFPGADFDAAVLVPGGAVVVAVVVAAVAVVAATTSRSRRRAPAATRRSWLAAAVAAAGAPVPVALGARLALEPGRGRAAVPVRPALVGAVVGVLGVVGAFTFRAGVDRATTDLTLFGQTWDAVTGMTDGATRARLVDDPEVALVNDTDEVVMEVGERSVTTFALRPLKGDVDLATLDGRAPEADDEIALAPVERDALGVDIGDDVMIAGPAGDLRYRVVGVALTPSNAPHTGYDEGAWVTSDGQRRAAPDPDRVKFRGLIVGFGPGVDAHAAVARLNDEGVALEPVAFPEDALMLRGVRNVPLALGAFLGLLAVGAVGHALASAVRRRRRDVVVLRVLGLTRGQARACVAAQATTLALVGLAVGVPLGILIARALWRSVALSTPFIYAAPLALVAVAAIGPVAIAVANALAAGPGRRAARLRPAEVLRAE